MKYPSNDITGFILAGGKSRRMGSDKGLLNYNGRPMVQYSIDLLSEFCSRIIISTSNPAYNVFGLETIPDILPDIGPMGGIYSCLKASKTSMNICLPCDIPQMDRSILEYIINYADGSSCIVPCTPFPEPLVAIYPTTVIPIMEQLIHEGKYKMTGIFNIAPVKYLKAEEFPGKDAVRYFRNLNSPIDMKD